MIIKYIFYYSLSYHSLFYCSILPLEGCVAKIHIPDGSVINSCEQEDVGSNPVLATVKNFSMIDMAVSQSQSSSTDEQIYIIFTFIIYPSSKSGHCTSLILYEFRICFKM